MRYYASFFFYGLRKTPVIVAEELFNYNEQFESKIGKVYSNILHYCKYKQENNYILIYNTQKQNNEFIFRVKPTYKVTGPLMFELQLYVKEGFFSEIKEKYFINTVLYTDKLPEKVIINTRPVFKIKNDKGTELGLYANV